MVMDIADEPERPCYDAGQDHGDVVMRTLILLAALLVLPGCLARTAVDLVTFPVKAGSQAADWATTSQDEADRNRGRKIRKEERREAKERRREEKEARERYERDD